MPQQRILILMSDTGGGHRASAQALKAGFDELYPGRFHIDIVDVISDHLMWPLNQLPKLYPFLSNDAPWMWKALYNSQSSASWGNALNVVGSRLSVSRVRAAFEQYKPDLIISVHPLLQTVSQWAMQGLPHRIPFVTVVTDLSTGHPLWFNQGVDACYVASEYTVGLARKAGLRPDQVHLFGLPIRPAFSRGTRPKPELRRELGMDAALPAVLLIGGGEGVGPVEQIARELGAALGKSASRTAPLGQLVVICGRNRDLEARLAAGPWPLPVVVKGFVDNMPDWMGACDCIVTKAGPGTIAEALISGLPIVLSGYIPGQEEGNLPYVIDNGVGEYNTDPKAIAAIVARWFGPDRALLGAMSVKAKAMGHPQATFDIVNSITELLDAALARGSQTSPGPRA
jgi:1,2-diacylglycerol 3-beta-galactosyltransferase